MTDLSAEYRKMLVGQIKALAKDLDEMAEDLVGNTDLIADLSLQMNFSQGKCPTILVVREHIGRNASSYYVDRSYKEVLR